MILLLLVEEGFDINRHWVALDNFSLFACLVIHHHDLLFDSHSLVDIRYELNLRESLDDDCSGLLVCILRVVLLNEYCCRRNRGLCCFSGGKFSSSEDLSWNFRYSSSHILIDLNNLNC